MFCSEVLELPRDVLEYLRDTGTLVLPTSSHIKTTQPTLQHTSSDDEEDWSTDSTATPTVS